MPTLANRLASSGRSWASRIEYYSILSVSDVRDRTRHLVDRWQEPAGRHDREDETEKQDVLHADLVYTTPYESGRV